MVRQTHDMVNDHFGTAEAEQIASGTPTSGYLPVAAGVGAVAVWTEVETGGGGLTDLITGNDQDFAASLGSWTNSGGTMTRDTTYKMAGQTASLKFAVTTSAQYVEVPVAGTFVSGVDYHAVVFVSCEDTSSTKNLAIDFGLIGTDATQITRSYNMGTQYPYVGDGDFIALGVRWRPTADRTGVKLRFTMNNATTATWHIGMVRAWETPLLGQIKIGTRAFTPSTGASSALSTLGPWATSTSDGLFVADSGVVSLSDFTGLTGIDLSADSTTDGYVYFWADHVAGDLAQEGINIAVGNDFLGFFIGQKDATTVQFYADWGDYNFEFEDGAANGWGSVDASGVLRRFSTMESRKGAGTATITSGNTSISVTHGAAYTPQAYDIVVTPTNNPTNDPGNFWISSVGATTFTINVRADPGTSGATFSWRVDR